ncbi:MAG TPA: PrsW family glutamic-type intramembrane protease, partial [Allocoleopsis sp.]
NRLQKNLPQYLTTGDRITLGQNGAEITFELQPVVQPNQGTVVANNPSPQNNNNNNNSNVTFTQLFPFASTGKDLINKAYLIPGIITVTFVILMFASINTPRFNIVLGSYLAGAAYYFVYTLCGKYKPWWVLISSMFMTGIILVSPLLRIFIHVFREILPGNIQITSETSVTSLFIAMFFGAGLMEELIKALPIFFFFILGKISGSDKIGVIEPLDGILIGTASAVGFTLLETLGQYVPQIIDRGGELAGLQLLIPRILGSVAGHMAYSGYFGYFIGLSAMKPAYGWLIIPIGYLTSSLLHALWNTSSIIHIFVLTIVGIISYAFLVAAILKARALSPTRSNNFATRIN